MVTQGNDLDHGETEPLDEQIHDNSWSVNLEKPQYGDDLELLERHAIEAVERTSGGHHVNLVTHAAHGHPEGYLYETLEERFADEVVRWEYVEQCGCRGHVVRAHVE